MTAFANQESLLNKLENFNELCLIVMIYIMFFFVKARQLYSSEVWDAGTATITLLGIIFLFNLIYLLGTTVKKFILHAKLSKIRRGKIKQYRINKLKARK